MSTVDLNEAQSRLPEIISGLNPGEQVAIVQNGEPLAMLTRNQPKQWPCAPVARKTLGIGCRRISTLRLKIFGNTWNEISAARHPRHAVAFVSQLAAETTVGTILRNRRPLKLSPLFGPILSSAFHFPQSRRCPHPNPLPRGEGTRSLKLEIRELVDQQPIVRETACKTILNRSSLGGYSLNCYTGCAHACVYCYARFMQRFHPHDEPWGAFVDVKVNAVEVLKRQLLRATPGNVFMSRPATAGNRSKPSIGSRAAAANCFWNAAFRSTCLPRAP